MFLCLIIGVGLISIISKGMGIALGTALRSLLGMTKYAFDFLSYFFKQGAGYEGIRQMSMPAESFEEEGSNLGLFIVGFVVFFIALGCMIRYRREILIKINDRLSTLLMYFKYFISNVFKVNTQKTVQHTAYCDQLESINTIVKRRTTKDALSFKKWKKLRRQYLREENTNSKYYKGYALVRQWLQMKHIEILISDSPLEIYNKADCFKEVIYLDAITKAYNRIKYGQYQATPEEFRVLDEVLREIGHINK